MSIFDLDWAVPYMEQALLVQKMSEEVVKLEKSRKTVLLRQFFTPTKAEWEDAWLSQTTLPLPIPVGAKLIWYNTERSLAKRYTVTNDTGNGASSSGTPLPFVNPARSNSAIRLIAEMFAFDPSHARLNTQNPHNFVYSINNSATPSRTYNILMDWRDWMNRGLVGLWVVFQLRSSTLSVADGCVDFTVNIQSGDPAAYLTKTRGVKPTGYVVDPLEIPTLAIASSVLFRSPLQVFTQTNLHNTISSGVGVTDPGQGIASDSLSSLPNFHTTGYFYIGNPALQVLNGKMEPHLLNVSNVGFFVSHYNTTFADADGSALHLSGVSRVADAGIVGPGITFLSGGPVASSISDRAKAGSRAWIYGLFAGPVESELTDRIETRT